MSGVMTAYLHRDSEGWYAVSGWNGDPIVFRLPEEYDPRDDEAQLVFEMLGKELVRRIDDEGECDP